MMGYKDNVNPPHLIDSETDFNSPEFIKNASVVSQTREEHELTLDEKKGIGSPSAHQLQSVTC